MPNAAVLPHVIPVWLPRIIEAAILLALAWMLAGWLSGGMDEPAIHGMAHPDAAEPPDVVEIAAFPLFGRQASVSAGPKSGSVPPVAATTRLNIRLLGTVVAGDRSSAVMRLGSGKEMVVFIGGDIQPGVRLEQVDSVSIVVDNRGRKEKVLMAKGSLGTGAAAIQDTSVRHTFSREAIRNHMQDLPKLLTGALAVPHQMNGKPDGFLIEEIVPGSLYEQAGLKNGDVIGSVNGQKVDSPEKGLAMFQALQTASSIDLEITRAGVAQRLHFDIH